MSEFFRYFSDMSHEGIATSSSYDSISYDSCVSDLYKTYKGLTIQIKRATAIGFADMNFLQRVLHVVYKRVDHEEYFMTIFYQEKLLVQT